MKAASVGRDDAKIGKQRTGWNYFECNQVLGLKAGNKMRMLSCLSGRHGEGHIPD